MLDTAIAQQLESRRDRVRDHSGQGVNRRILQLIEANVERCNRQGRDAVVQRLAELDREWDIDRVLMANFAIVGGTAYGVGLSRFARRPWFGRRRTGWLYFFGAQLGFMLLHATVGWCPPVVVWRRMGVRTKSEIEVERNLLLAALAT